MRTLSTNSLVTVVLGAFAVVLSTLALVTTRDPWDNRVRAAAVIAVLSFVYVVIDGYHRQREAANMAAALKRLDELAGALETLAQDLLLIIADTPSQAELDACRTELATLQAAFDTGRRYTEVVNGKAHTLRQVPRD